MSTNNDAAQSPPVQSLCDCVQVFEHAFSESFCTQMISSFASLSRFHKTNGKGVMAGHQSSVWTELDITPLTDSGFRQVILDNMLSHLARYNAAVRQPIAIPGTDKLDQLVIKRYQPGASEHFELHFDSIGPVANRYLVFLWYLNDVSEGGETVFPALDLRVAPKQGRLLMFPPYWMFQHEGRAPLSNDKYIFSTYFLF
jgi:prolyl 4-hydroxylase